MPRLYVNPSGSQLDKDGRTQLFFKVKLHGKWHRIYTGIKIVPAAWNVNGQEVISGKGEYNVLTKNKAIENLRNKIEELLLSKPESIEQLREQFKKAFQKDLEGKELSFFDMFDYTYNKYKNSQAHDYIRACKTTKKILQEYDPSLNFGNLDHRFYHEFCDYLLEQGKANSTIANRLKIIRKVLREAERLGIKVRKEYTDFTFSQERQQPMWLTWQEVGKLEKLKKLSKPERRILDTFLFRCYTGLRQSDVQNITRIHGNEMLFDIHKTKKQHTIKLNDKALAIAKKYNGSPPVYVQQHENRVIKDLCERAGITSKVKRIRHSGQKRIVTYHQKNKLVSSHTARRTFARRWVELGGSIVLLSKYLGHSSVAITQLYIGFTDEEIGNEALRLFN